MYLYIYYIYYYYKKGNRFNLIKIYFYFYLYIYKKYDQVRHTRLFKHPKNIIPQHYVCKYIYIHVEMCINLFKRV